MKKLLTSLLSAALIAMPLAMISTPTIAQAQAVPADNAQAPAKPKAKAKHAKSAKKAPAKKTRKAKGTARK